MLDYALTLFRRRRCLRHATPMRAPRALRRETRCARERAARYFAAPDSAI